MPTYNYKARDTGGNLVQNTLEAQNETDAAARIGEMGLVPITIAVEAASARIKSVFAPRLRKVSRQEMLIFTRELATLISTGIPLIQALQSVADHAANVRFAQILNEIVVSIKGGASFSAALSRYPEIFNNLYVSLVKVGEAGGLLDKVLLRLAELGTQDIDLRSRVRSVLIYPAVLALIAFVIVTFVLIGVLPKFVTVFEASQAKLPIPTQILLGTSGFLRNYWWALIIGVVVALNIFGTYYRSVKGRLKFDALILRMPLFGPLILKVMVTRFARSIAALTRSGIPILEALGVVEGTVSNMALQQVIGNVRVAISRGQSLTEPFAASGLFPPMVIQLINTGERSGKIDAMFEQIASFYEPDIEFTIRNLTSLLEPIMLLGMGLVVAFIALSVLMPIFNLISVVRR